MLLYKKNNFYINILYVIFITLKSKLNIQEREFQKSNKSVTQVQQVSNYIRRF